MNKHPLDQRTSLIRSEKPQADTQAHSEEVFVNSSFVFKTAAEGEEKFKDKSGRHYVYSRYGNPTVEHLQRKLAKLENAQAALCTASGMSAIACCIHGLVKSKQRVLLSASVFGSTVRLLEHFAAQYQVELVMVPSHDLDAWAQAAAGQCALAILETPANPTLEIYDIEQISKLIHKAGGYLLVDNCFCPIGQKPLQLGADIVVHSCTKYIDGQGRAMGGAIIGNHDLLYEKIYPFMRFGGPCLAPWNAWLFAKSLDTLTIRYQAHCQGALTIATWLQAENFGCQVIYSALPEHPQHKLAMHQQQGYGGGIITLRLGADKQQTFKFIDNAGFISITPNFGDAKTTITHPASTTHSSMTEDLRKQIGISDDTVRLSIGLEEPTDIKHALRQAFTAIGR